MKPRLRKKESPEWTPAALPGEERMACAPGGTLTVPAGTVHGAANRGGGASGRIRFFIPETDKADPGCTGLASGIEI
jgi:hypothetical protein